MTEAHSCSPLLTKGSATRVAQQASAEPSAILSRAASTGQLETIAFLAEPAAHAHTLTSVDLVETHMSLVLLARELVFKLKRAIQLKHLDMRKLGIWRTFCRRELELNGELAPDVYLGTVAVT